MTFPAYGGWAGDQLLVWSAGSWRGHRFDPAKETYTWLPSVPDGALAVFASGAFASQRFFAFDHAGGAAYDWTTDTWTPIAKWNGPKLQSDNILGDYGAGIGTANHLVFLNFTAEPLLVGGVYEVASDTWTMLPPDSPPAPSSAAVAATASELLLWGTHLTGGGNLTSEGWRLVPATLAWTPMSNVDAPPAVASPASLWTGKELFVFGSSADGTVVAGGRYDIARNAWTSVSSEGAPTEAFFGLAARVDDDVYVASRKTAADGYGVYHLDDDTWSPLEKPTSAGFLVVLESDGCRIYAYFVDPNELWIFEPAAVR